MNGFNVYDGLQQQSPTDNARAWVIFDPTLGANFVTQPVPLQDELVSGAAADFYNNNYRRYRESDPVRTFQLTGGSSGVPFLRRALELTFFPELYAVRTELREPSRDAAPTPADG